MKKIVSIGFVFCLIFSIIPHLSLTAFALNDLQISPGGTTSKVTYSQSGGSEEIRIYAPSTAVVRQYVIPPEGSVAQYRIGFEIAGITVSKSIKFDVNKGSVKQIRLANSSDGISVVVDITKKPDYTLAPSSDGKSVVLKIKGLSGSQQSPDTGSTPKPSTAPTPEPTATSVPTSDADNGTVLFQDGTCIIKKNGPLSWTMSGDTCVITLDGIKLSQTTIGSTPRFELREREKIIQITLPGRDTRFKEGFLTGNSVIYGVLVNYNSKHDDTIIRISYPNTITFTHAITGGSSVIRVKSGNTTVPGTPSPKPSPSSTPAPSPSPTKTPATSNTPTPSPSQDPDANVSFVFDKNAVTVSAPSLTGIKVYRLGDPSRIIMEVTGKAGEINKIMSSSSLYSRAVVDQASANLVKVQLYTKNMPEWSISKTSGKFKLTLSENEITNIEAGDGDGSVSLRLTGPDIADKYQKYEDKVIVDDSVENSNFTFMMPKSIVDIGDGTATINDGLTKSVVAFSTPESSILLLNKVDPDQVYKIIEGSDEDELLIVASTPEKIPDRGGNDNDDDRGSDRLVVIDPGHGGSDPGGTVGSYFEKNYNLDISLKCEKILKANGVKVAMTRTTDVFVPLYDRAEFANERDAALFVCIHNNIMPRGYKGSMTLYYSRSYKGKAYAQIIQKNMVNDLGTGDIGLKASSGLVVLKATKMPAVLAEVACMSDESDMAKLNTESFRQKAAESIAKSIMQILEYER